MKVVKLEPDDAPEVEKFANRFYPPYFRLSQYDIRYNLDRAENKNCNFCFALKDSGKILGYIMAWIDNTRVANRREDVVVIDDIVVSPEAKGHYYDLLKAVAHEMDFLGYMGYPVETVARKSAGDLLLSHGKVIARLGYEPECKSEYYDSTMRETMVWVRFTLIE